MKSIALAPLFAFVALIALASTMSASAAPASSNASQSYSEYQNARWHFSIFIPDDYTAEAYDARGGETIQFVDSEDNWQFQVSAWPYSDLTIHSDRLQLDPPSDANDQPDELGIVHVVQDDLFEILFSKSSITYVVQTLPENATSTIEILKSWQFI